MIYLINAGNAAYDASIVRLHSSFVEFYDHAYKQSQLQTFFQNDPAIMNNNMFAT